MEYCCPYCGSVLQGKELSCPSCGYVAPPEFIQPEDMATQVLTVSPFATESEFHYGEQATDGKKGKKTKERRKTTKEKPKKKGAGIRSLLLVAFVLIAAYAVYSLQPNPHDAFEKLTMEKTREEIHQTLGKPDDEGIFDTYDDARFVGATGSLRVFYEDGTENVSSVSWEGRLDSLSDYQAAKTSIEEYLEENCVSASIGNGFGGDLPTGNSMWMQLDGNIYSFYWDKGTFYLQVMKSLFTE